MGLGLGAREGCWWMCFLHSPHCSQHMLKVFPQFRVFWDFIAQGRTLILLCTCTVLGFIVHLHVGWLWFERT